MNAHIQAYREQQSLNFTATGGKFQRDWAAGIALRAGFSADDVGSLDQAIFMPGGGCVAGTDGRGYANLAVVNS